ncbi:MAG TPA: class I SAM-dependent methyltransferase, partial [Phycisphaerae bacterium]
MPDSSPYSPHDSDVSLESLDFLATPEGAALRETLSHFPKTGPTVAQIAKLRKQVSADVLHAALVLAKLQPKARAKFPGHSYVWAVPEALEQSTDLRVGAHKAQRFAPFEPANLFDLCAGIGGDTLGLAQVAPVIAIDLSAVRMRCLELNLAGQVPPPPFKVETKVADITGLIDSLPPDAYVHMDPSRRWNEGGTDKGSARRSARYEDLIPGPPVIQRLSTRVAGLALKLSPAVDFTSLPPGHLELISHHGSVVQAVLWMGKLTEESNHDKRTATVLSDDASAWSFTGRPGDVMINPVPEIEHFLKSSPSPP